VITSTSAVIGYKIALIGYTIAVIVETTSHLIALICWLKKIALRQIRHFAQGCEILSLSGYTYVALDSDAAIVERERANGFPVFYGDVRNPEVLYVLALC
jgi:DNA-binding transcriptional regulator of glucitol operon